MGKALGHMRTQAGRQLKMREIAEYQQSCAVLFIASGAVNALKKMMQRVVENDRLYITIKSTYATYGKGYDDDNAMLGLNKAIIDPLVRGGILPDDSTRYIRQTPPVHKKIKRGKEPFIKMRFELQQKRGVKPKNDS